MLDEPDEVTIRAATLGDVDRIAEVHVTSWREAYSGVVDQQYLDSLDVADRAERWRQKIGDRRPGEATWVAGHGDRIEGFAHLAPSRDEDADRSTLEITSIYLEPRAWGRGVARELMRTVLAAVPVGSAVTLWVLAANERARHFYRRHGFVPDGVERMEQIGSSTYLEVRYLRR